MVEGLIDIIIVNWNSGELLKDCVNSILTNTFTNYIIHVMDNGSTDDSVGSLPNNNKIAIHSLNKNLGFGKACNEGLQYCNGDFILLLNPDTIIRSETLSKAIHFMKGNRKCIVYGCAQEDEYGSLQKFTVGRFPNVVTFCNEVLGLSSIAPRVFKNGFICTDWDYAESRYVDHVMGSFYLIRADWVKKYGFMDDRYFVYLEDIELSKKVINSGGKIYYDRENIICHKQGGISKQVKAKRLFYSLHAKHLYIKKHFSFLGFLMCDFVMLIPGFFSRLIHAILIERRMTALKETVQGHFYLYKTLFSGIKFLP